MSEQTTTGGATPDAEAGAPEVAAEVPEPDTLRERLVKRLRHAIGDAVVGSEIRPGDDVWVRVTRETWREAGQVARDKLGCRYFCFLSAVDWLPSPYGRYLDSEVDKQLAGEEARDPAPMQHGRAGGDTRFQVFARVANLSEHFGITLKCDVPDEDLRIDSWVPNYHGANWHERECWEMFGIDFVGHPFLRHLYLPGGFEGYPLRKDFPLLARVVKPWPGIVDVEGMPAQPGDDAPDDEEGGG